MSGNHHIKRWHGIPRDEIEWQPLVQSCLCDGCGLCVTSCPAEALAFDFQLQIPFVNPARCLVGCSICTTLCPHEALLLPDRSEIQDVISRHQLAQKARRELHLHRRRFAGVFPEVISPEDAGRSKN